MTEPIVALITGVGGQDGGYLAERLIQDGYAVWGLARDVDTVNDVPAGVRLVTGDLRDRPAIAQLLAQCAPSMVFNLGGQSSVAASWRDPEGTMAVNAHAATALLEECADLQERLGRQVAVVQAASAEIFGQPATSPQDEATPIAPVSPYGQSKAIAHAAVEHWRDRGLHASSLILYNHESPRRPASFVTRKITSTVARIAATGEGELVLGNLAARRDWGWAPEYVDAMLRAATRVEPDTYVIATGRTHAVEDFVRAAFEHAGVTGWSAHVRSDPEFFVPSDPTEQRGNAAKATDLLGWQPQMDFEDIVAAMVDADLARLTSGGLT